ncbi:hypothetical protein MNQ98_11840 [Paenibacillus sp. N3/727]|uniref:hypothetical protein n=1 Tax=Paenibacillus sp. N3/727 TaxID=2925845 RepID=UPI001F538346|nr:hypothetical protein [Paenibacillus sp. N3/727]UNK20655.1 hypothetical protein MNQ98_11840 [Paenibacillus sp. N3/727]
MIHQDNIYVLLTDTGTMFTRMIKRYTSAPYNHASLALDKGLREVYSFGRKCATNPWSAGFVEEDIYEGVYRYFPETRCVVLRLNVSAQQRIELKRLIQYFNRNKEAYKYNLVGLLFLTMKINFAPKNAYFCSQFVAEALRVIELDLWNRPSALITPNDFLIHPAFETVYEGMLYDYPKLGSSMEEKEFMIECEDLRGQVISY